MKKIISLVVALAAVAMTAGAATKTIAVKNGRDLIKAIGPDRTIVVKSHKPINITEALQEMVDNNEIPLDNTYHSMGTINPTATFVTYSTNTDGIALQVRNCSGLVIRGEDPMKRPLIVATPRYVNVIEFFDCHHIKVENLTMGHTEDGYCDKGVVEFAGCADVEMNNCDLYGCGTEGVVVEDCNRVAINRTAIHHCTYHTLHVLGSNQVRFNDCTFFSNREYHQINVGGSEAVEFTGCTFSNLEGPLFNLGDYCYFFNCTFENCEIEPITEEWYPQGNAILAYCTSRFGNPTTTPLPQKPKIELGRWTDGTDTYIVTQSDPYRFLFRTQGDDTQCFAINCVSAERNSYISSDEFPYKNKYGALNVDIQYKDGTQVIRILDDGHQPIKSLFYLGK